MAQPSSGVRVTEARVEFTERRFRAPLILSTGPIERITEARVTLRVEGAAGGGGGRSAEGRGVIYLSDLWAWPDPALAHEVRDAAMRRLCEKIAQTLPDLARDPAHALHHGLRLEAAVEGLAKEAASAGRDSSPSPSPERGGKPPFPSQGRGRGLGERRDAGGAAKGPMSRLAALVCASPFDAALHDAYARWHGVDAYAALTPAFLPGDLSGELGAEGRGRHLSEFIRKLPHAALQAWHIVGKNDALTKAEFRAQGKEPLGDGLPNCVEEWIERLGIFCFKLKISGKDNRADVQRTVAAYAALREIHDRRATGKNVILSIDSNEANPDVESVVDYLELLRLGAPEAYAALAYIEQPTGRNLERVHADLRPVAVRKPVLVDEGLTGLELLPVVRARGWSGVALKTCKGHSSALLCAAFCHLHGMPYTLQDLTNPGLAWIHGLSLAAHLETFNGVELNAYQYTPRAIGEEPVFQIRDGWHSTEHLKPLGLGA